MAQLTSFLSRSYSTLILMASLVIILAACTPPTPPPSPTTWSAGSPTSVPATATSRPTATPTPTPTPEPSPSPTPPKTTIVIWESLSPVQAERLAEDIQAFHQEFPQFTVVQQHYDSPEQFMTPLMAGDINFDMVLASPVLLGSLQATQQIAPVSNFFPPSFFDAFDSVTLQGVDEKGQLWGVPDTAGFHLLLFYNRDLIDTPPTNTDELWETAQTSQGAAGTARWGLGVNSYDPLWLVPWLAAYGGWLTDDTGQPTLDTPAMESAIDQHLSWLGRASNRETVNRAIAPVTTYEEARAQFLAGDIAMMIDGEWALTELAQADTINWGSRLCQPSVWMRRSSRLFRWFWSVIGASAARRPAIRRWPPPPWWSI